MILSREEVRVALFAGTVPGQNAHLNGDRFATLPRAHLRRVWDASLSELEQNAPELVERRPLGNSGKSEIVPRYVLKGFNCRGHHLNFYRHLLIGFALKGARAAVAGTPLEEDALACGLLEYTAIPRAENLGRKGRHEQVWFLDEAGIFQTWEAGDGGENEFLATELASVTFLYAQ